jgi:hypothetical protein
MSDEPLLVAAFLNAALLGGLLGAVGQGVRAIIGLKKAREEAAQEGRTFAETFEPGRLMLSLAIGFVAGVLGLLTLDLGDGTRIAMQQVVTLIAIGYAGTDFIEGFMQRTVPDLDARAKRAAEAPSLAEPPAVG